MTATLVQKVAAHPLAGVFACVGWMFVVAWVITIVHAMVGGEIEAWVGVLAIGVALGLGALTIDPPDPAMAPLFFAATIGTMVLLPFSRHFLNRRALKQIDIERVADCYQGLALRPGNPSYILPIASTLWQYGHVGPAVAIGDRLLSSISPQIYIEERRMVNAWKQMPARPGLFDPIVCPRCGHSNPCHELYCEECRAELALLLLGGRFWNVSFAARAIALWVGAMAAIVGIPWSVRAFPPNVSMLMILGQVLLVAGIVVLAFRRGKTSS
ncbi:MAG: hypothetical protein HONBIEJF_00701 [Fimbriimonadaceae bacterium]|nr:hypothetical protein [Fimbriimonadaceae bacterium]